MRKAFWLIALGCLTTPSVWASGAAPPMHKIVTSLDLSGPFRAHSSWTFTAVQEADIVDPTAGDPAEMIGGAITLCLSKDGGHTCNPKLLHALHPYYGDDLYSEVHFLRRATIEHPALGAAPLLVIQAASLFSVDGDQLVATRVFSFSRKADRFTEVFHQQTGHNNNQEIRYIENGPLRGAIVSAEPTRGAPFHFWMTVNEMSALGI